MHILISTLIMMFVVLIVATLVTGYAILQS